MANLTIEFQKAKPEEFSVINALIFEGSRPVLQMPDEAVLRARFDALLAAPDADLIVGRKAGETEIIACYQIAFVPFFSQRLGRVAILDHVSVTEKYRSQGVGKSLIKDAENRTQEAGCGWIELLTHKSREDAHRFYVREGYVPSHIGFKKQLDGPGEAL